MEEPLRDSRSLVVQMRDRLAELVREEGLRPGDKLPTEAQLTQRFKISRPVLREAFKLLEQDNIIYVEHGRGRFVSAMSAVQVDRPITVFESVTDMTRHFGYKPATKVLSISEEVASDLLRGKLKLDEQARIIRIERLRMQGPEPIIYSIDYVPRSIIPTKLYEVDWSGSLLDLLEQYKNRPRMSAASVSAVMLPSDVIGRHGLEDFGPALLIAETCFNAAGLPVNYALDYHRGTHFTFSLARK